MGQVRVNQRIRFLQNVPLFPLSTGVGTLRGRAGMIQGNVGGIQVLAGLAPSSRTVVCNIRTLRSHLWWLLPPLEAEIGGKRRKTYTLVYLDLYGPNETVLTLH
jgi:hypothetical protein